VWRSAAATAGYPAPTMSSTTGNWRPTPGRSSRRTAARNRLPIGCAMDSNRLDSPGVFDSRDNRHCIPRRCSHIRLTPERPAPTLRQPSSDAMLTAWCVCRLDNDLPFSSERRGRLRAYHGREEPRAQPAASRHEPTSERACVAFGCCNGRLDGTLAYFSGTHAAEQSTFQTSTSPSAGTT